MSGTLPANEPECLDTESSAIELLIDARPRDLGGFAVRRVLPSARRRLVGPFIFLDHMDRSSSHPTPASTCAPIPT